MYLVTDRSQKHIDLLNKLSKKTWNQMTLNEKEAWLTEAAMGAYNHIDLNRVESAVAELAGLLGLTLVTKTDWNVWDYPCQSEMERYLGNVVAIRNACDPNGNIPGFPPLPESMNNLTYEGANNIELTLSMAYTLSSIKKAVGTVISISDAIDSGLAGLKIFGKTTQDSTPTPNAPIPLVSAGDGGSITIKIGTSEPDANAQTLTVPTHNGLPGIPVASGGNYTDDNGQQWICDEIDFANKKYVQRVKKVIYDGSSDEAWYLTGTRLQLRISGILFPKTVDVISNCLCDHFEAKTVKNTYDGLVGISLQGLGNSYGSILIRYGETTDLEEWKAMLAESPITCLFALATPVETYFYMSAYEKLCTYDTTTTVYNDSGAGMEVSYYSSVKKDIDKKFSELEAAIVNS